MMIQSYLHYIAVLVIALLSISCILYDIKNKKPNPSFPTLLITCGIAFTFLGIALGLKNFDIANTIESLPQLIDGIKTAFWGSLSGIVGAIVLKALSIFYFKEETVLTNEENQIQKFYEEHTELLKLMKKNAEHTKHISDHNHTELMQLKQAQHNSSLKTQQTLATNETTNQIHVSLQNIYYLLVNINNKNSQQNEDYQYKLFEALQNILSKLDQMMHTQNTELRTLQKEFGDFSQHQIEKTSDVIVSALRQSVSTFNEGLMNQLGQNFQDFHNSMKSVLEWQKQYSQHVEDQTRHYQTSAEQLTHIQNHFSNFTQHADALQHISNHVNEAVEKLNTQSQNINEHLEHYYQTIEQKNHALEQYTNQLQHNLSIPNESLNELGTQTTNIAKQMQSMQIQIQETFTQTHKTLETEILMLQQQHNDALNESLLSLARQLGSISSKFAQDYEPITLNLKSIMQKLNDSTTSNTYK